MKRVGEEIDEDSFYGNSTLSNFEKQLEKSRAKRSRLKYLEIFKPFYKLDQAIEFVEKSEYKGMLSIFSFENNESLCKLMRVGSKQDRFFLVSHVDTFWDEYEQIPLEIRHFYEVIPFWCSCNLYFDLEFLYEFNPNVNGSELVQEMILLLEDFLYDYNVNLQPTDIVDLDSCTGSKFSKHLIIHMKTFDGKRIAFENYMHIKNFVAKFVSQLPEQFLLFKDGEKKSCLIDEAVYTKNRSFRLYMSTKKGKQVFLLPNETNQFKFHTSYDLFINHLVVCRNPDVLLQVEAFVKPFIIPSHETPVYSHDYPEITESIQRMIQDGRDLRSGQIAKCEYFPTSQKIHYYIKNYRFCENIQRPHKSNSIYYIVDVEKKCFYQKCFDPDCKDFRSNDFPLK